MDDDGREGGLEVNPVRSSKMKERRLRFEEEAAGRGIAGDGGQRLGKKLAEGCRGASVLEEAADWLMSSEDARMKETHVAIEAEKTIASEDFVAGLFSVRKEKSETRTELLWLCAFGKKIKTRGYISVLFVGVDRRWRRWRKTTNGRGSRLDGGVRVVRCGVIRQAEGLDTILAAEEERRKESSDTKVVTCLFSGLSDGSEDGDTRVLNPRNDGGDERRRKP